ncbi:ABC transporter substrate-binding protein [Streptomyces hydrogenans]|uniref:ABC transporter substrate-binding protein n=1 Tax=Streptomyces hydrogenans TaxID=1873719 RepID=UPI0037F45510
MSAPPPPPVRIGVLAPLSRPGWTEAGRHLVAGCELAAEEVGATGGIAGRPLALVVRDTAADPRRAEAAVDELAGLGAVALAGEYHSVAARAAAARADALGLPFLCSSAVIDALTDRPTDRIARLAPPQSRGWRAYADFLLAAGHARVAVATEPSAYWAAGTGILRAHLAPHGGTVTELDARTPSFGALCDTLAAGDATALLLLTGFPDPAVPLVRAVRRDPRLADLLIGAPAGQPEFAGWAELLGGDGGAIPFLRYLPADPTPLGAQVAATLRERLGAAPSFVALEGHDTVTVLAEALRSHGPDREAVAACWPHVVVEGTRGKIRFTRPEGSPVWQWAGPPLQVTDRNPADPTRFRTLHPA